jgi:hypothetical protein
LSFIVKANRLAMPGEWILGLGGIENEVSHNQFLAISMNRNTVTLHSSAGMIVADRAPSCIDRGIISEVPRALDDTSTSHIIVICGFKMSL